MGFPQRSCTRSASDEGSTGSGSCELSVCDEDSAADSECADNRMSRVSSLAASERLRTTLAGSTWRRKSPMGSDCLLGSLGVSARNPFCSLSACVSSSSVSVTVGDSLRGNVANTFDSGLNGDPSSEETSSPAASTSLSPACEAVSACASVEKSEWSEESTWVPTSERLLIVSSYLYLRCGVMDGAASAKGHSQPPTVELQSMRQLAFHPK